MAALLKFLTYRAIHAASSANHAAAEGFPADRTGLAVMSINLQKRRVAVVPSLCGQIFLRRSLVLFDKKGQPLRNRPKRRVSENRSSLPSDSWQTR